MAKKPTTKGDDVEAFKELRGPVPRYANPFDAILHAVRLQSAQIDAIHRAVRTVEGQNAAILKMQTGDVEQHLTKKQTADILQVSTRTIERHVKDGKLTPIDTGEGAQFAAIQFRAGDVFAFKAAN